MTLSRKEQEMVSAAAQAGRRAALEVMPVIRNAMVMAVDPTNAFADVVTDGTTTEHPADNLTGLTLLPGDRVKVMYTHPSGCVILGTWRGDDDDWHVFGDEDAGSPFLNGWGHRETPPASVELNSPIDTTPAFGSWRRRSGTVELRGWIEKLVGSANNAVDLNPDCWPENDLWFPALDGVLAHTAVKITRAEGRLSSALGAPILCLDGIMFTGKPRVEE